MFEPTKNAALSAVSAVKETQVALPTELSETSKRRARLWGAAFIAVGVPGLFLPILQGVLLILIGFMFLSLASKRVQNAMTYLKNAFPRLSFAFVKAEQYTKRWLDH